MPRARRLVPLVLATIATQSSIVVLAPLIVEISRELDASVSAVGLARSVMAGTAVIVSLTLGPAIDRVGVRPLIVGGAGLAIAGAAASAAAPSLPLFYAAHLITGSAVGCLLSAGFAGVAALFGERDVAWAMGWVVGAQSIAWIAGNPIIGALAESGSWRLAYSVPAMIAGLALVAGLRISRQAPVAGRQSGLDPRAGLAAVFRDPSARRWAIAELVAYCAWTAELTYAGAFYIQNYGVSEATVGLLLAGGSTVFLVVSPNVARLAVGRSRRRLIVVASIAMGTMFIPVMGVAPSVGFTFACFCALALFASVRSTTSSALGLDQLPERPGSMMGARTASAQLGYMVGAAAGGAVLALSGFRLLGFVLFAGMLAAAALVVGVRDPGVIEGAPREPLPEPVPD